MASIGEDVMEDSSEMSPLELEAETVNGRSGLVSQLACHFCGLDFDVKKTRSLRAHIEEVHVVGGSSYMCGVCCEEFPSRKAVETHMSTQHRTPKPFGCGVCGETFRIRNMLVKHIDAHSQHEIDSNEVGLCYCGECFEFFPSVAALHTHTAVHKEQSVFVCGACGLQTQYRHIMVKHLECHVISSLLAAEGHTADASFDSLPVTQIDYSRIEDSELQDIQKDRDDEAEIAGGGTEIADCEGESSKGEGESADSIAQNSVQGETEKSEEDTSYKCGVCSASFTNLEDALGHAENHQEDEFSLLLGDGAGNSNTCIADDVSVAMEVSAVNEAIENTQLEHSASESIE